VEIGGAVALVTGAGSGIGRAIATALAEAGAATVAVVDLDLAGAEETVDAIRASGRRATAHRVDVGDAVALAKCFADVGHAEGPISIVCNNAGIVSGGNAWPATSLVRLDQVINTNLKSVVFGTRLAVEQMVGRGGAVVNTASVAGLAPLPWDAAYAATKAAVIMFTRSCASLAETHRVRVNSVCPGVVDTPILAKTGDGIEPASWLAPMLSTTTLLQAADVARAVLELVTDDSRAGENVIVPNA
jgi:NAD(P)-dependent dehydrogenase (short-subunit alcohol dehydrogenase family)